MDKFETDISLLEISNPWGKGGWGRLLSLAEGSAGNKMVKIVPNPTRLSTLICP
jgi:hypothetical protein